MCHWDIRGAAPTGVLGTYLLRGPFLTLRAKTRPPPRTPQEADGGDRAWRLGREPGGNAFVPTLALGSQPYLYRYGEGALCACGFRLEGDHRGGGLRGGGSALGGKGVSCPLLPRPAGESEGAEGRVHPAGLTPSPPRRRHPHGGTHRLRRAQRQPGCRAPQLLPEQPGPAAGAPPPLGGEGRPAGEGGRRGAVTMFQPPLTPPRPGVPLHLHRRVW